MKLIQSSETTVDFSFEYKQHLYHPIPGAEWVKGRGGFDGEDEARQGIRDYLYQWHDRVDKKFQDHPPREFRIVCTQVRREVLGLVKAEEFDS